MPLSIDIMEDERRRKQREEEERMRVQAQNQQMNTFATQPSYTYTRAFNEPQTAGQFLGNIIQLQQTDPLGAEAGMALFNLQTKDPTSNLYNPYMESTNKAVSNLAAYGIDTSNMDDNWYNEMYNQFAPYWQYNGTTNTPSSPGKKASAMEKAAYEFYQIYKSKNDTDNAKKEWEDLQKELSYWANRTDRNYSDDEIINMIDWSKYSTLKKMDDSKQLAPMELNEGIGYSKDAMYGVLWAARNGQDTSNTLTNMAYSALGVGNKWEDNPEIRAKLDRGNKATYSPFSVGGTADDVLSYFGVGSINQAWIDANAPKLANGSDMDRKMLGKAIEAVNTTTKAQEELAALNADVQGMIDRGKSADFIQKQIDKKLKSTYTTLAKMDSYIDSYGTDDFVGTTEAVDYKYSDLIAMVQEECTAKSENETNGFQTVSNIFSTKALNMTQGKEDLYEDSAPAEEAMTVISDQPVHFEADANGNMVATQEPKPDTHQNPVQPKVQPPTEEEIAQAKELDAKVNTAREAADDYLTDGEKDALDQAGSVTTEKTQAMFSDPGMAPYIDNAYGEQAKATQQAYWDTMLGNMNIVHQYETQQENLSSMQTEYIALKNKWGDVRNYTSAGIEQTQDIVLDDPALGFDPSNPVHVILEYNPDLVRNVGVNEDSRGYESSAAPETQYGGYEIVGLYDDRGNSTEVQGDMFFDKDYGTGYNKQAVMAAAYQKLKDLNDKTSEIQKAQKAYEEGSEEDRSEIDRMKQLNMEITKAAEYIDDHAVEYRESKQAIQTGTDDFNTMYSTLTYLNGDTFSADKVNAVLDYVSGFYTLDRYDIPLDTRLESIRRNAADSGITITEAEEKAILDQEVGILKEELDNAYWVRDWLAETGYALPEDVQTNFDRHIRRIEHDLEGYDYDNILLNKDSNDFNKYVEAGRKWKEEHDAAVSETNEATNSGFFFAGGAEDAFGQAMSQFRDESAGVMSGYTDDYWMTQMTDDEKDIYYYLAGKAIEEGKASDNPLDVPEGAANYIAYMADGEYGILTRRNDENFQEAAQDLVNSGPVGGVLGNLMSTLYSDAEIVMSGAKYLEMALNKVRGIDQEYNEHVFNRVGSHFKAATREETNKSIDNYFSQNKTLGDIAKIGYEIYCSRGDSALVSMTMNPFGELGEGAGGIAKMALETVGAAGIGITASLQTFEEAIENGATEEQAYALAGVAFLAETVTEGVTESNIRDIFSVEAELGKETLKTILYDWLRHDGLEEAFGESFGDFIEKKSEEWIMQENSQHQKMVDKYMADNPGMTKDQAENLARTDELKDIAHTALVSYLSAGTGVIGKVAKAGQNTFNAYRTATRNLQQTGYNVSLADVIKADRQDKQMVAQAQAELDMSLARQAQADAAQALREEELRPFSFGEGQTEQTGQTTETNTEAAAETAGTAVSENTETKEAPAIDQTILTRPKVEITPEMKAAGTTLAALEESKRGDNSTKTAAIAAAMTAADATPAQQEVSLAAAAGLRTAFGNQATNIVQRVMIGAQQAGIETETMQQALHYAALGGEESSCYQTIAHENFANMTPADQAKMLASAVYNDSQNATVQQNMAGQVEGFAKAMAIKNLAANGHFDEANEAQRKAEQADADAKKAADELDTQKSLEETKAQQTQDAVQALNENPGDHALADQVNHALTEQENQSKVTQEYEQAKAKADEQAAEAHRVADKKTADATTTARVTSEQQRNEQLEQRRIEAEARAEEQRVAAEEAAKAERQQKIDDSRSGKLQEESDEAKIRRYAEGLGYTGEQLESFVQEMSNFKKDLDMKKVDLSKQLSPAEGYLMMGRLSRRFGVNVVIGEMANGDHGSYNPDTNTITLSKDLTAGQVLVEFALHEFTHSLESTGAYQKYHDNVLGFMYPSEAELNKAIADKIAEYADNGHDIDDIQAKKELVAEYTRTKLNDRDVINRMIDAGLGGRMRNALHNINQFFRNLTRKMSSEERQQAEYLRRAERMLNKAIREKARTQEKAETAKTGNNVKMNPNGAVTLTDWTANGNKGQDIDVVGVEFAPEDTLYITEDGQRIPRDHFEGGALGDGGQRNATFGNWVTGEAEKINQQENKPNDTPFSSGVGELTEAQKAQMLREAGVDYQNALERGDMEAAQEDVDFAAEQAGYTIKAYHGSPQENITQFDINNLGANTGSRDVPGFFFTNRRGAAEAYLHEANEVKPEYRERYEKALETYEKYHDSFDQLNGWYPVDSSYGKYVQRTKPDQFKGFYDPESVEYREYDQARKFLRSVDDDELLTNPKYTSRKRTGKVYDTYLAMENPYVYDAEGSSWVPDFWSKVMTAAKAEGGFSYNGGPFDGIIVQNFYDFDAGEMADEYVVFDPNQIKSADPVTYDDNGNVIPLEERFNVSNPDIRYSSGNGELTDAQKLQAIKNAGADYRGDASGYLGGHTGYQARNGFVQFENAPSQTIIDNLGRIGMQYNSADRTWTSRNANVPMDDIIRAIENGNRGIAISAKRRPNARSYQPNSSTATTKQAQAETTASPLASREMELNQALLNAGVITQEELDNYYVTSRALEGQNPTMSTAQGPKQRQFGQGMLQDSDEISAQAKAYVLAQNSYYPDTNAEQIDRAINWIRASKQTPNSDGFAEALQKVTSNSFDYRSADGQARMVAVMGMAVAKGDTMAQVALADAFNRQGTDLGRALQARKLFRLMTPEGRISSLQKMLSNAQDEINQKGTNIELKFSDWIYQAAAVAENEEDFYKVRQAASQELGEQIPANWRQKFIGWRMVSMLGNPRTHIRNIVGNAMFVPFVGIKNKVGALLELGLDESKRTKTLGLATKEAREFAKQDAKAQKDALTGEAKYKDSGTVKVEQKLFGQGKGLLSRTLGTLTQGWSDLSSDLLEKEDWVFLSRHYRNALAGYMTARNLTAKDMKGKTLEDARQYAITEAQKATYRDFNSVASWLNSKDRPEAGRFLADAVLPFKKTPMNITKRGFEYSPLGLIKSLSYDIYRMQQYKKAERGELNAMPKKAISPAKWIDNIASGLTGSAIVAAGYLLGRLGVVNAGFDDDDPEDRLKKLKNEQEYSINIAGENITLDWAAPVCLPFFVGAQLGGDGGLSGKSFGEVLTALLSISEPIYNLSMMDGVNSLLQTSAYEDEQPITQILEKIGLNYVSSYVPTIVGQVARTIDPTRRATFVQSGAEPSQFYRTVEQIQNKLPFLTKLNTPYMNAVGEKQEKSELSAAFENFVSPAYYNKITESELYDEWKRLIPSDTTGKAEFIPSNPSKTIKIGQETIRLTDTQYATLKEVTGTIGVSLCEAMMQRPEYQFASDENKIALMNLMWDYAKKAGQKAVDDRVNTDGWIKAAETSGDVVGSAINKLVDDNRKSYLKEKGASLAVTLESGQYEDAQTVILEMRETAKATDAEIREQVSNYFRPLYYAAVQNGQDERAEDILEDLRELDIGYKDSTFKSWYKNALGDETAEEDEDDDEEGNGYLDWLNR